MTFRPEPDDDGRYTCEVCGNLTTSIVEDPHERVWMCPGCADYDPHTIHNIHANQEINRQVVWNMMTE